MKENTKKWIKIITYLMPVVWLILRNYIPAFMQFDSLNTQGYFLLFIMFGLCTDLIIFPKFEMFCILFNGSPGDKKFEHTSKLVLIVFMIIDVMWMIYSVNIFNVFTFWNNNISQIIFLFTLTWYLWFNFGMNLLRYVDVIKFSEENILVEE